jgi:hypothetical protein
VVVDEFVGRDAHGAGDRVGRPMEVGVEVDDDRPAGSTSAFASAASMRGPSGPFLVIATERCTPRARPLAIRPTGLVGAVRSGSI